MWVDFFEMCGVFRDLNTTGIINPDQYSSIQAYMFLVLLVIKILNVLAIKRVDLCGSRGEINFIFKIEFTTVKSFDGVLEFPKI